jgi:ribosomal protein S18 acetylase RimI-like enzyme
MPGTTSPSDEQDIATAIALRPVRTEDAEFLFRVYASTRVDEMALTDWSRAEQHALLQMQFNAQHQHYQTHFHDACFDIIERDGQEIGRLYVDRRAESIHIIDIALLPEHRKGGVGNLLLQALLVEASAAGLPVNIHVERNNPALQWYERLGFVHVSDQGIYCFMRWSPEPGKENPKYSRADK